MARAYEELKDFTHTASHDLKAPLRHIVSYCEILRDEFGDRMGPEGLGYTLRLIVNAQRLQRLVDDLLAYSLVTDSLEEMRYVDFDSVTHEVLETLEESVSEAGAVVSVEGMPRILAYPVRVRQLLQNLISNAIKYRRAETPQIIVRCEEAGSDHKFSVADNGLGIEPDYLEMIFDAFKRLHSRDDIEGSGLGLCICRKIVAMHKGRIWVESTPGKGSTFYFTIPKGAAV